MMVRLLLLTISCIIIFVGFALPFVMESNTGLIVACMLIILGSVLLWYFEFKSKKSLEEETTLSKILKTDGENIIERK